MIFETADRPVDFWGEFMLAPLPVYTIQHEDASPERLEELRCILGWTGGGAIKSRENESSCWGQSGRYHFRLSRFSGEEFAFQMDKFRMQQAGASRPIEPKQAVRAAAAFLRERLAVGRDEIGEVGLGRTVGGAQSEESAAIPRVALIDFDVVFRRRLAGVPVIGPGSRIIITVNSLGEITAFRRLWPKVVGVRGMVNCYSNLDALAKLRNMMGVCESGCVFSRLVAAKFGYWSAGRHWRQQFLAPSFYFCVARYYLDNDDDSSEDDAGVQAGLAASCNEVLSTSEGRASSTGGRSYVTGMSDMVIPAYDGEDFGPVRGENLLRLESQGEPVQPVPGAAFRESNE